MHEPPPTDPPGDPAPEVKPHGAPRRRRRAIVRLVVVLAVFTALAFWPSMLDHVRAAVILSRVSGLTGWYTRFYDAPFTIGPVHIAGRHGPVDGRVYRPANRATAPGIVLLHGVQYMGMDDDRLDRLATELARGGFAVLTPEIASLSDYRLTSSAVNDIEDAIEYFASRAYVRSGRVAVVGASFAGGLALVAAAAPRVRPHVAAVLTVGGQHRVDRVVRSWLEPSRDAVQRQSRAYGLQVFVCAHAESFVAPEHAAAVRDAVRAFLHADLVVAEQLRVALTDPAEREFVGALYRGDRDAIAPYMLRALPAMRDGMTALSPAGRISALRDTPVILIHGRDDAVIPAAESEANARELAPGRHVLLLVTDAIDHVHVGTGGAREQFRMVHALAVALAELR